MTACVKLPRLSVSCHSFCAVLLLLLGQLGAPVANAQHAEQGVSTDAADTGRAAETHAAELAPESRRWLLVVSGLGGGPEYQEQFDEWMGALEPLAAARRAAAGDDASAAVLLGGTDITREQLLEALTRLAESAAPADEVTLMLLGHGSYDGENFKFNLRGPDVTDTELLAGLDGIAARRQLIVVATSASGALLRKLDNGERVLISATKSGGEINAVRFPEFWIEALSSAMADLDHNELLTVEEAFEYAQARVDDYYSNQNQLATEHPRLLNPQGEVITLARLGSLRGHENNPEVNRLLDQRLVLERDFQQLRTRKSEMRSSDFYDELEQIVLDLARLQIRIDAATGWQRDG